MVIIKAVLSELPATINSFVLINDCKCNIVVNSSLSIDRAKFLVEKLLYEM